MKLLKLAFITLISVSLLFCSCKKKPEQIPAQNLVSVEITKSNHTWYYFSSSGFDDVDRPQNAPQQVQKPWTESIRISSANNEACTVNSESKAYAVVNRLGILSFKDDTIYLSQDTNVFADRTADNLVFLNNVPVFSVYKSAFFNDTILAPDYKDDSSAHLFLLQFDTNAKLAFPLINCNNLTDKTNSEVTDFYWNGLEWCCSLKTISDVKNEFSYFRFKPLVPLLTLSPSSAENKIDIEECDADFFRNCRIHYAYKDAPDRIKKLLSGFDTKLPFVIEVKNAGGSSPRIFENSVKNSTEKELNAKAILSANWSAALFEDGTLFLEGALPGKHILRSGMPVAIRLPKLPVGFVYSDFVISGTTLYAAWEESSFYKTGRAGFLQVNLERTLYSRLI